MLRKGSAKDDDEDPQNQTIWKQSLTDWMVSMAMVDRMIVMVLEEER